MEPEAASGGTGGSVRRSFELIARTLQNRAELLGVELEAEGRWVVAALFWTAASILFGVLSAAIITVTIILLTPEHLRMWALLGFCALYLFGAVYACTILRRHFNAKRPALFDTVNELKKDLDWIQSRD